MAYKKKIYLYLLITILPIFVIGVLAWLYKSIVCYLSTYFSDAKFICEFKWKDGAILLCSYCIVKVISPFLKIERITGRLIFTLILYSVFFAAYAFPFWVASLFSPLKTNTFVQAFFLILLVELLFFKIQNLKA